MEIVLGLDQLSRPLRNGVVTLGNFDGIHLGHQKIFQRVKQEALRIDGEAVVITFEPHPLKLLSPHEVPPLLTPFKKKMVLIESFGIDTVLCLSFSRALSETSPYDFVKTILADRLNVKKIIVGYNYHFGKGKEGDAQLLKILGQRFGIGVEVVPPLKIGDTVVSSSKVRELILGGKVEQAARLLGRNYLLIGTVVEGARRGQTLGFPTANLEASDGLYPRPGVYAVEVIWNRQSFDGVANVGRNPTFSETDEKGGKVSFEVYILNFNRTIYGEEVEVQFRKRIRDEVRFDSAEELIVQIRKDVEWAQENVFKPRYRKAQ